MKKLEDYLKKREGEFEKIKLELDLLKSARMSLLINEYHDCFQLYSSDYHLAEDFKIMKRTSPLGGFHGYDGGYSTNLIETYPQFYFNLKCRDLAIPVYIQHEGFYQDKRIVVKSVTKTDGCKDYSDMKRTEENHIDLQKVLGFFAERGVNPILLERFKRRIKEAGEF